MKKVDLERYRGKNVRITKSLEDVMREAEVSGELVFMDMKGDLWELKRMKKE